MKKSKYNIFTKNGNGEILIYNTLSNRYVKIIGKKADRIYQELLDEQEMDDLEGLKCLQKYGIIVDNDYNEKIIAESRFMNLVYSGETLDITVIPTEDCNFRCIYCYESSEQNYMDKETQSNILKWFRKNLKGYKHLIITINEQILKFAQNYPTNFKTALSDAPFFLNWCRLPIRSVLT